MDDKAKEQVAAIRKRMESSGIRYTGSMDTLTETLADAQKENLHILQKPAQTGESDGRMDAATANPYNKRMALDPRKLSADAKAQAAAIRSQGTYNVADVKTDAQIAPSNTPNLKQTQDGTNAREHTPGR